MEFKTDVDSLVQKFGEAITDTLHQTRHEILQKILETEALLFKQLETLQTSLRVAILETVDREAGLESGASDNEADVKETENNDEGREGNDEGQHENSNSENARNQEWRAAKKHEVVERTFGKVLLDRKMWENQNSNIPKVASNRSIDQLLQIIGEDLSSDSESEGKDREKESKPKPVAKEVIQREVDEAMNTELSTSNSSLINAKRVVSAYLFKSKREIQLRQSKPTPKKLKDAFSGHAAVSFMLESFGLNSRSDAVILGSSCLIAYITCVSNEEAYFEDDENHFYNFKFPVFMFPDKLQLELESSINLLLQNYGPKSLSNESGNNNNLLIDQVCDVIETKAILLKDTLEICNDRKGKRWQKRVCLLYATVMKIYKTAEATDPILEIPLQDFKNISYDEYKYDIMDYIRDKVALQMPFIATYIVGERRSIIMFRVQNDAKATAKWALAIDGLKYQDKPLLSLKNACCLDTSTKLLLLRMSFKDPYKGGLVKSADEEWQYSSDGLVTCLVGSNTNIKYNWTGELLQPSLSNKEANLGTGRWDGANLWWFPPTTKPGIKNTIGEFYYSHEPHNHYIYNANEKEYLCGDIERDWKWTRHFLASKGGDREWILEGFIPEPVVMLLQMMRYYIQDPTPRKIIPSSDSNENSPTHEQNQAVSKEKKEKRSKIKSTSADNTVVPLVNSRSGRSKSKLVDSSGAVEIGEKEKEKEKLLSRTASSRLSVKLRKTALATGSQTDRQPIIDRRKSMDHRSSNDILSITEPQMVSSTSNIKKPQKRMKMKRTNTTGIEQQ